MKTTFRLAFAAALVAGLAACSQLAPKAPALGPAAITSQGAQRLTYLGTSSFTFSKQATQTGIQNPEFPQAAFEHDVGATGTQTPGVTAGRSGRIVNRIPEKQPVPASPPRGGNVAAQGHGGKGGPGSQPVLTTGPSFQGLNHFDQRYADGGNQFSLEPPDQGLCVGQNYVFEAVNDVVQLYTKDGTPQGVASLNQFFYHDHAINRTTGVYGQFITDPSCLYSSSDGGHWYLVVLTLDVDPTTGAFLGTNHLDIAVSAGADPTGAWNLYSIDVSHDGSAACAPNSGPTGYCLGDYPHFAVNADGLFITTDSFPFFTNGYNGAWLYGVDKSALDSGASSPNVVAMALPNGSGQAYSVAPAITVGTLQSDTQYLVSATTENVTASSSIAVMAVTDTKSLDKTNPSLVVTSTLVGVGGTNGIAGDSYGDPQTYSVPQKRGNVPLAQALTGNRLGFGAAPGRQTEGPVGTNDSGMKQAVFVNNKLYSALTTIADNGAGAGGGPGAGAAWFAVTPSVDKQGNVSASLDAAGVVAPQGRNVIFPAITVDEKGNGAIAVTLVGPNDYPSAAVIPFDANTLTAGAPQVIRAGAGPQDGFTEYWLGGYTIRWGDYGAAMLGPNGGIWVASEMINQTCRYTTFIKDTTCGGTRSALANWSTQITHVTP